MTHSLCVYLCLCARISIAHSLARSFASSFARAFPLHDNGPLVCINVVRWQARGPSSIQGSSGLFCPLDRAFVPSARAWRCAAHGWAWALFTIQLDKVQQRTITKNNNTIVPRAKKSAIQTSPDFCNIVCMQ